MTSHALHFQRLRACPRVCTPKSRNRVQSRCLCADSKPEQVEIGWLWTVGKKGSQNTRAALQEDNFRAKKSLGQNFLTDDTILENIAVASGVTKTDVVLEVGPGTGNLTKHIVPRAGRVVAIEKDDRLFAKLQKDYAKTANLKLVHDDILKTDLEAIISDMLGQARSPTDTTQDMQQIPATTSQKIKVVANLPYNITKEFLTLMLPLGDRVSELSIMIQHEVAQRLVKSKPGDADYRAMSLRVQYFSKPKYRFRIPRGKYYPVPGVDGALVTFALLPPSRRQAVPDEGRFLSLVAKAFSERRKMMRNSLQPMYSSTQVEAALVAADLQPEVRAQDLSLEEFSRFCWALETKGQ